MTEINRIHQIIKTLNYSQLLKDGIIPKVRLIGANDTSNTPSWVNKLPQNIRYLFFGKFTELLIQQMICSNSPGDWLSQTLDIFRNVENMYSTHSNLDVNDILQNIYLQKLTAFESTLRKHLESNYGENSQGFDFQKEFLVENVQGHPDFVHTSKNFDTLQILNIYEIKTTTNFKNMRNDTLLQMFSYFALAKKLGNICENLFLVLPLQNKIIEINISGFDFDPYFNCLVEASIELNTLPINNKFIVIPSIFLHSDIGYCIPKIKSLVNKSVLQDLDIGQCRNGKISRQIYVHPRQNYRGKLKEDDCSKTKQILNKYNYNLFIHAPNLRILSHKKIKQDYIDGLISELTWGNNAGCKGVVVHCGSSTHYDVETSLNYKYNNICMLLEYACEECPLLLETCCGQGNDLCANIDDFIEFYSRFDEEQMKKFKICVDTCHVFVSGQCPFEALIKISDRFPGSIKLVHLNDSRIPFGKCVDRHAPLGMGFIDNHILELCILWCLENDVSMVRE